YQLNIDGQQVTNNGRAGAANPRVSQEAVGEFQFIASRWDASQGRSNGVLVNAVTKSGTNTNTGSFSASFRNARFNSPDFVQQRVLPYSNQRFNGTYGERNRSVVDWPHHPQAAIAGVTNGAPRINFNGYSFGNNNTNWPQTLGQQVASLREDFTYSFNRAGRHDVKTGGEYLNTFFYLYN